MIQSDAELYYVYSLPHPSGTKHYEQLSAGTSLNFLYASVPSSGHKGEGDSNDYRHKSQDCRVHAPVPAITSCLTVGKSLNVSEPHFLPL